MGRIPRKESVAKIGENRDAQHCDHQDLSSELKPDKCYKVSVSSGRPKSGADAANLLVQWTADGVDGQDGLKAGDETRCLKKPVTKLKVHCNLGASVTYSLVECKCP
jgi:hypothetical protein